MPLEWVKLVRIFRQLMNRYILSLLTLVAFSPLIKAQQGAPYHESDVFSSQPVKVSMSSQDTSWLLNVKTTTPQHGTLIDRKKAAVDARKQLRLGDNVSYKKASSYTPDVDASFVGNTLNGTPADNSIAVSNDGVVVSAVNSNLCVYDKDGERLVYKPLAVIAKEAGNFTTSAFDPHLVYDVDADRFILVFLSGSNSNKTNLVVGFTQTNDPAGDWNFYAIAGNVHDDNTWSDYPFVGITNDEVFIPVLLWFNGESGWDSEAQELIWQIDKKKGYAGQDLEYKYYDKIKVSGRQVWNTRPVWGSTGAYGPNMYFLANRAIDEENDSIFLFEITNTLASGKAELKTKIAKADVPYGIPPSAYQPRPGDSLRTNYADIHGAFLHYGAIHFVANSISKETGRSGVYYGVMSDLEKDNPKVEAQVFSDPDLDLNYPNIAYAGGGGVDRSCMINVLHSSKTVNPGTSALFVDRDGEFSDLVTIKEGESFINVLSTVQERWGDYISIQTRYNEPGTCWLVGSYGNKSNRMEAWIAEVKNTDPKLGTNDIGQSYAIEVFPNPVGEYVTVVLPVDKAGSYDLSIQDLSGRTIKQMGKERMPVGAMKITLNTEELLSGNYLLLLSDAATGQRLSKQFVKY